MPIVRSFPPFYSDIDYNRTHDFFEVLNKSMVKLKDAKGKSGEAFTRLLGNADLGKLLSRVQASLIRGGNELENLLAKVIPLEMHTTLDELSQPPNSNLRPGIQVVFHPKRPDPHDSEKTIQADLLVVDNEKRLFMLIEVKDGDTFDTKKSDGELESLRMICSWLAQEFPYKAQYYICAFNQSDRKKIIDGTKKRFSEQHVMTGIELCAHLGVDFDTVREMREVDQTENREYFLRELLAIYDIKSEILRLLELDDEQKS